MKRALAEASALMKSFGSELYQFTLACRASFAVVVAFFDADAERSRSGPTARFTSEGNVESSVRSPAKAQAASGTRDFTGILPIVLVIAFSLRRPTPC
jgi:hypothetical protein